MDAVWIDVPEEFLEERARLGHDRKDELWEGVLHLVPPAASPIHGFVAFNLCKVLTRFAERRGFVAYPDGIGIYAPEAEPASWRIPDGAIARPEQVSDRGLEGALLAVEVLSPRDESRKKFGFYARVGLTEVGLVDPKSRQPENYTLLDGAFALVPPVHDVHRSPLLGITLRLVDGPRLQLRDDDDIAEI